MGEFKAEQKDILYNQKSDKKELLEAIREEKAERRRMKDKLEKVYESRDRVTVSYGRLFPLFNAFISAVVALAVSLFTKS